ncbi:MAG: ABC-F family ATP-binding cassette domain-containing protein [Clostridiales bacterium]|nr:ABC-F family ATP-binding cassette domain-containing protein [Clostridiales bacterium]
MNILSIEKISKSYSEKILFDEISLGIDDTDKIGLIGINGTGKSTFLKVVAGIEKPDKGKIVKGNNVKVAYLFQSPEFESGTTVLEQVFKGNSPVMQLIRAYENALQKMEIDTEDKDTEKRLMDLIHQMDVMDAWSVETEAKAVLMKLGISDFHAMVDKLSGGQRKRVAMASVLITPSDLLILDEPTNHIDNDTVDWLEKYIGKRKGALLMVTHDRYLLDRISNKIIELDGGNLYSYQANYTKYLEMKLEREALAESSERKKQNLIRRELAWIQRGAKARSTKQKARIDRFKELTENNGKTYDVEMEMGVGFSRLGRKIIEIENIYKRFECCEVVRNFSYILLRDDRVGIIGPNGCGKSTLVKMIAGELMPDKGIIDRGETVKIGYFSQENTEMDKSLRVIEYIREIAEYITTESGMISASQMLERFLFPPEVQWTPISKLSGGELRRLHLLGILMKTPNILILDEPTNDLDIQTLTILESYLDEFQGAVIAVSHDRYFLDRVVDKIFSFEGNGSIKQYNGNYSDYLSVALESYTAPRNDERRKNADKNDDKKEENKIKLKFTYKEQKEFDEIDDKIALIEENISKLESEMSTIKSDFEKLQKLVKEKEKFEKMLEDAIERWTVLHEMNEEMERNK